eukprot:891766-Pleurochrysis_carterae.AAC.1
MCIRDSSWAEAGMRAAAAAQASAPPEDGPASDSESTVEDHDGGVAGGREHEDEASDLAAHLHCHGMPLGQATDAARDA